MIRLSTVLWLVLVSAVGFGMFEVKYAVMGLEDRLAKTNRAIAADQDAIHVLDAEWSYLSQPSRLETLSRKFLDLGPVSTAQLGQIETLPMRPAALPPSAAPTTTLPPQIASRSKPAAPPAATTTAANPANAAKAPQAAKSPATPATQSAPTLTAPTPTPTTPAPAAQTRVVASARLRTEP